MNRSLSLLVLVLLVMAGACRNRQQGTATAPDSTATASAPAVSPAAAPIGGRVAGLGLTPNSHWRGINLGDDFGRVKTTENGELFESDAQHAGYTIEFPNLESVDVLYYQKGGKVSAIGVDLFLNNRASVDAYQRELSAYFTARYGAAKSPAVWKGPSGEQIRLNNVSKGKDFGLKLTIAPATGAATASTR